MKGGKNTAGGADGYDPMTIHAEMAGNLAVLSDICSRLEKIADGLPMKVDPVQCAELARTIHETVVSAHLFEEKIVFPYLRSIASDKGISDTIERLRFEHWEDESFAAELQESLCSFATGRDRSHVEALAWMLRGFFEGLRRHIAFEREHMMPLLAGARA